MGLSLYNLERGKESDSCLIGVFHTSLNQRGGSAVYEN